MRRQFLETVGGALVVGGVCLSGCAGVARAPSSLHAPTVDARWTVVPSSGGPVCASAPSLLTDVLLAQDKQEKASESRVDANALFSKLGCTLCHAPGARYHELLGEAAGKSEEDLARWIRNPEKFIPGTTMPTYASLVDEPTARVLARWLKNGGPGASAGKK